MKVIYIAGPYRSDKGEYYVQQNIRQAEACALWVWEAGAVAICPHKNTESFGGALGLSDDIWLQGDLELIERSDAVWAIKGCENSVGATAEIEFALEHSIPVFMSWTDVIRFIRQEGD